MKATLDEGLNSHIRPNKKKIKFLKFARPVRNETKKGFMHGPFEIENL